MKRWAMLSGDIIDDSGEIKGAAAVADLGCLVRIPIT
jgi:hypothetical protein